jgi:hypothetical protein
VRIEGRCAVITCQVIDLELDEQARPRGAQVRCRGWSARGLFWGDDALLYESAPGGRRLTGPRRARMAVR